MTPEEIQKEKERIDVMSQEDMARLWRFAPSGHPYFVSDSELCKHFKLRFNGFTPEISKRIG